MVYKIIILFVLISLNGCGLYYVNPTPDENNNTFAKIKFIMNFEKAGGNAYSDVAINYKNSCKSEKYVPAEHVQNIYSKYGLFINKIQGKKTDPEAQWMYIPSEKPIWIYSSFQTTSNVVDIICSVRYKFTPETNKSYIHKFQYDNKSQRCYVNVFEEIKLEEKRVPIENQKIINCKG